MTTGGVLARLADLDWLMPVCRAATRVFAQFRPFVLHVDEPSNGVVEKSADTVQGWFLAPRKHGQEIFLQLAGVRLTWIEVSRKDAMRMFGDDVRGFRAIADIDEIALVSGASTQEAKLELVVNGRVAASKPLLLLSLDTAAAEASQAKRTAKREWLMQHLACPTCGSGAAALTFSNGSIRCHACNASFEDNGKTFNFLPEELKREFKIADWDNISAHAYDEVAQDVIQQARASGGKVLDCGSGLRPSADETVICLEVDEFPNVDVLGVNQKLPFQNGVFDAVLSLNVLEHVTDPFVCARELMRVLKPGGTLYCCIPFLQPEHGYPDHYFNATRAGLRQLFSRDLELVRHFVPGSGQPVWTLHWFLAWYVRELPPAEKTAFLSMRIQDILADSAQALLQKPWVKHLSENGKWQLASSTAALFRKPGN